MSSTVPTAVPAGKRLLLRTMYRQCMTLAKKFDTTPERRKAASALSYLIPSHVELTAVTTTDATPAADQQGQHALLTVQEIVRQVFRAPTPTQAEQREALSSSAMDAPPVPFDPVGQCFKFFADVPKQMALQELIAAWKSATRGTPTSSVGSAQEPRTTNPALFVDDLAGDVDLLAGLCAVAFGYRLATVGGASSSSTDFQFKKLHLMDFSVAVEESSAKGSTLQDMAMERDPIMSIGDTANDGFEKLVADVEAVVQTLVEEVKAGLSEDVLQEPWAHRQRIVRSAYHTMQSTFDHVDESFPEAYLVDEGLGAKRLGVMPFLCVLCSVIRRLGVHASIGTPSRVAPLLLIRPCHHVAQPAPAEGEDTSNGTTSTKWPAEFYYADCRRRCKLLTYRNVTDRSTHYFCSDWSVVTERPEMPACSIMTVMLLGLENALRRPMLSMKMDASSDVQHQHLPFKLPSAIRPDDPLGPKAVLAAASVANQLDDAGVSEAALRLHDMSRRKQMPLAAPPPPTVEELRQLEAAMDLFSEFCSFQRAIVNSVQRTTDMFERPATKMPSTRGYSQRMLDAEGGELSVAAKVESRRARRQKRASTDEDSEDKKLRKKTTAGRKDQQLRKRLLSSQKETADRDTRLTKLRSLFEKKMADSKEDPAHKKKKKGRSPRSAAKSSASAGKKKGEEPTPTKHSESLIDSVVTTVPGAMFKSGGDMHMTPIHQSNMTPAQMASLRDTIPPSNESGVSGGGDITRMIVIGPEDLDHLEDIVLELSDAMEEATSMDGEAASISLALMDPDDTSYTVVEITQQDIDEAAQFLGDAHRSLLVQGKGLNTNDPVLIGEEGDEDLPEEGDDTVVKLGLNISDFPDLTQLLGPLEEPSMAFTQPTPSGKNPRGASDELSKRAGQYIAPLNGLEIIEPISPNRRHKMLSSTTATSIPIASSSSPQSGEEKAENIGAAEEESSAEKPSSKKRQRGRRGRPSSQKGSK